LLQYVSSSFPLRKTEEKGKKEDQKKKKQLFSMRPGHRGERRNPITCRKGEYLLLLTGLKAP